MEPLPQLDGVLRHPLFLLLVGALVTGLGVPAITRNWQQRQKRLEVKTALVTDISEVVMRFMLAIQFVEMSVRTFDQSRFDDAYRDWEVGSAILGTKLQAYMAATTLPRRWTEFSRAVTVFYAILGTDAEHRPALVDRLRTMLASQLGDQDGASRELQRNALLQWKSDLIQTVMKSPIALEC